MVACRDAAELVTDYLEHTLPLVTRLGVRWHLFQCTMCRNYYEQMRALVALLGQLPTEAPPADAEDRLIAAAVAQDPSPTTERGRNDPV